MARSRVKNFSAFLSEHAGQAPDRIFVQEHGGKSFTYCEADLVVNKLAASLLEAGVQVGDRIAVRLPKSADAVLVFLAVMRIGAIYVPINTQFTPREVLGIILDAEPKILLISNNEVDLVLEGASTRVIPFRSAEEFAKGAAATTEHTVEVNDPQSVAAMLFTSGTTGKPKGAMLTHMNLVSCYTSLADAWHMTGEDRLLHVLPMFHAHGLFVALGSVLVAGGTVLMIEKFDAAEVVELLPTATVFMAVPAMYTRLLKLDRFDRATCSSLRLATSGSAALSPEVFEAIRDRTGLAVVERYGLTETGILTSNPADGVRKVGTVGLPLAGVELRIADKNGAAVERGTVGRIWVKSDATSPGYWRRSESPIAREDGFFNTQDLAFEDEDGYLTLVGREKDLIISGGYNVYPREIEIVIQNVECVEEAAVFGVPHPDFGEGVVAVLIPRTGTIYEADAIQQAVTENLAHYKRPKAVIPVEEFPRNALGKILKTELRERFQNLFTQRGENELSKV